MTSNPFWEAAEDALQGERVRVVSEQGTYSGLLTLFHYQEHAVLLRDVTTPAGETTPTALVDEPQVIEQVPEAARREVVSVDVDSIVPQPASVREYDSGNFRAFVRQVRQEGGHTNLPLVRPLEEASDGAYQVVSGHRRVEALRRAGIDSHPVEVEALSDWEATVWFIDEHFPLTDTELEQCTDPTTGWYPPALLRASYRRLREDWERERLLSHPAMEVTAAILEAPEGGTERVHEVLIANQAAESSDVESGAGETAEITRIASELAADTNTDEGHIRSDLLTLRDSEVPLEAAKNSLRHKYAGR